MSDTELPVAGTAVILRDGATGPEVLLMRRPDRGSFASAWVFPGGKVEEGDRLPGATERDDAARAAVRESAEEVGLRIADPVPLSCWSPPAEVRPRIRTWFFLAHDPGGALAPSSGEVEEAVWMSPITALAAHAAGSLLLVPPTWVTLHALSVAADVDAVFAAAGEIEVRHTRLRRTEEGTMHYWEGDEEHDGGIVGARHRLVAEGLPWRYERS
ncbi:8-oxo-dGTP pyrophosphatase MutT (NUDIX family) [Microbacterium resistens]|uniref:8-oxo-dGTP pyrophosphatase MutT (NUDIX family) n=1 Tax=Microbacterium resistens TaxID=156977 RepID=A0ABU1S9V0_9MICO|nr:NUDIX domain-containing protein [Microbacterium resistens]MDR6866394.1 8-oxo-dGTP pyrophosphatase MutT (NUDIX family) [Microbacterium resistens]